MTALIDVRTTGPCALLEAAANDWCFARPIFDALRSIQREGPSTSRMEHTTGVLAALLFAEIGDDAELLGDYDRAVTRARKRRERARADQWCRDRLRSEPNVVDMLKWLKRAAAKAEE